ncbi:hypothetical protein QBC47DRAFT_311698 [Echria macrotheca]|uniref:FAD-binding domain-containing protein n=1 Tax=Echria macrotheca TaxID=438768 RepID=A0AAJ0B3K5_9PEZI|nr:hypothetical protein QBC47DRAFT_311698 [Echria macrotheca]
MSVPTKTTVLVIGGGPAGSYAASVLAREGVDVTVLEADTFPRYHIGESMLASLRFFLRYIDLEDNFERHGFEKKFGASFKLSGKKPAYTDFSATLGPGGFTWNVVRSEADDLLFRHAGVSGAHIFDGTKVDAVDWIAYDADADEFTDEARLANPGRPVSARWSRKVDGASGVIEFDYLVDASGRNGVVSTRYLKNRRWNQRLKNMAHWGYWRGAAHYAAGERNENSPFFEALNDTGGWAWAIPLHDGMLSVGVAARQDVFVARKKAAGVDTATFYRDYLRLAPQIHAMLQGAELVDNHVKQASDWSYSANAYAGPHFRIAGDAGCFVDPYFSSGVHLAMVGGLAAAASIQAVRKGQAAEWEAAGWHSAKVAEAYTRFLLLVMSVQRQLRLRDAQILTRDEEDGFDLAFHIIQPVIQGAADTDVEDVQTQERAAQSVDFALDAIDKEVELTQEQKRSVLEKVDGSDEKLAADEVRILGNIVARVFQTKNIHTLHHFMGDVINGLAAHVVHRELGLVRRD